MPRVAAIADQFIQSANLEFSDTGFGAFVGSFQEHSPLQMAELWALIPALKLSLLEQIAHRSPELLEDPQETMELECACAACATLGKLHGKTLLNR